MPSDPVEEAHPPYIRRGEEASTSYARLPANHPYALVQVARLIGVGDLLAIEECLANNTLPLPLPLPYAG